LGKERKFKGSAQILKDLFFCIQSFYNVDQASYEELPIKAGQQETEDERDAICSYCCQVVFYIAGFRVSGTPVRVFGRKGKNGR
jgi:hypothetical protein